ncbi:MAG TPA: oligoendopeptidase F [Candidatus Polarisedimenticolaceae bacterium]|nr:oligoendopeptidase F [Candidatus Polarisedimenticolaceae bacterium]
MTVSPAIEETWRLTDLYPSDDAFWDEKARVDRALPGLGRFRDGLTASAAGLAEALETIWGDAKTLARLHAYASMKSDGDLRVAAHQRMRQEIEISLTELSRQTSYIRPEILAAPDGLVERLLSEETRLQPFAPFLRNLIRQKRHVLSPPEERLLAEAGLVLGGPSQIFGVLNNAEMPRATIELAGGESVTLTPAVLSVVRTSSLRDDRTAASRAYFAGYVDFQGTFGSNLFEAVKAHVFRARARHYESCVAATLDGDHIPVAVYTNLIEQVRRHLPTLHRYFHLRARALGLDRLTYFDLHCPLIAGPKREYGVDAAKSLVGEALEPLGAEYGRALRRGFDDRWTDWRPAPGKRSGAYATGAAYDVHPYMLLNFNGDFESVSTLAHEAGHAMHSHFSNRAQHYACADYSIFVAEVASTFNEALLIEKLIAEAAGREERVFLLGHSLDGIRATLFRQTFFAEFELEIHRAVERGEALTGEALSARFLDLVRVYQGHDEGACEVDPLFAIEWACIPHFYYDFYVYQYATGIVAATSLAHDVLHERDGARDRYLAFLASGASDYPLELLRRAGVDLESPTPYEATFRAMDAKLDALEAALDA